MTITTNNIYNMDCVDGMKMLSCESIDLIVTSPPYDDLRTYNGYSWDFQAVANEIFRVMKPGGVVVWVVNDATTSGSESGSSFKQALYFKNIGFNLHDTMIWVKDGGGAVGSRYCYSQNFEFMFVFSKGKPKAVNLICDKPNRSFGQDKSGAGRRKKSGEVRIRNRKPASPFSKRNNWWYIPPQKGGDHPAVFPERLAEDHIRTWSNPGDIILDPFMGSGTTGKMALLNKRKYIGFEISEQYCKLAKKRISDAFEQSAQIEFEV